MASNIFSAQSDAERSALWRPAKGLFWCAAVTLLGTGMYVFAGNLGTVAALVVRGLASLHSFQVGWVGVAITLFFVGEYARRRTVAGARMRHAQAHPEDPEALERARTTARALTEWVMQHHTHIIQLLAVIYSIALLSALAALPEQLYPDATSPEPSDAVVTLLKTLGAVLLPMLLTIVLRSGIMLQSILGLATPSENAGFRYPQPRLPWESDSDGYGLRVNAARLAGELTTVNRERDAYECLAVLANATRTLTAFETGRRGARRLKHDEGYVEWVKGLNCALSDTMSREVFVRYLLDTVPGMTPTLAERLVANPLCG